jgi:hypothetical protein
MLIMLSISSESTRIRGAYQASGTPLREETPGDSMSSSLYSFVTEEMRGFHMSEEMRRLRTMREKAIRGLKTLRAEAIEDYETEEMRGLTNNTDINHHQLSLPLLAIMIKHLVVTYHTHVYLRRIQSTGRSSITDWMPDTSNWVTDTRNWIPITTSHYCILLICSMFRSLHG